MLLRTEFRSLNFHKASNQYPLANRKPLYLKSVPENLKYSGYTNGGSRGITPNNCTVTVERIHRSRATLKSAFIWIDDHG